MCLYTYFHQMCPLLRTHFVKLQTTQHRLNLAGIPRCLFLEFKQTRSSRNPSCGWTHPDLHPGFCTSHFLTLENNTHEQTYNYDKSQFISTYINIPQHIISNWQYKQALKRHTQTNHHPHKQTHSNQCKDKLHPMTTCAKWMVQERFEHGPGPTADNERLMKLLT